MTVTRSPRPLSTPKQQVRLRVSCRLRTIKPRACSILLPGPTLSCQVTREEAQRVPLRLKRYRPHAAVLQAIHELIQAWQCSADVATSAAPEHLGGGGCAWPRDRVEVLRARFLGPEQVFSTEHERIESVDLRNARSEIL